MKHGYAIWDIETSIKTSYKRKANPFDPENIVVASGYKFKGQDNVGMYFGRLGKKPFDWFTRLLDGTDLIVGVNIKFDLLYALRESHNYEAWQNYIVRGGRVWDCQLAEFLLQGMDRNAHMVSLDQLAVQYGGTLKVDEVKSLWEAGVDTADIDRDLLMRYLVGEGTDLGDIGNTEVVFLGQLAAARKSGQVKSILLNNDALLCTVEMERNGMFVDRELGEVLAKELEEELVAVQARLNDYLPTDLPFEFNWNSGRQKSALIFGGAVKYDRREYLLTDGTYTFTEGHELQAYAQKDEVQQVLDADGCPVIYKSGKNAGEYKTKKIKVDDKTKPKSRMGEDVYVFNGYTQPMKEWEGAVPGVYSTSAEVIEELGNRDIPFLKDLSRSTSLTKDLGTYFISVDEDGNSKGMLTMVQPDSIIHHMLNMCSTVTARLSSSNPNLQNIPKGKKSKVKLVFKSRFGGKIIQSDFTALEIYIQAILTQCKQLIDDLKAGLDLHCVRVSQKEGISYEEALYRCKDESYENYKDWDYKRTEAKVFSFQRAYGAGVAKISSSTGIAVEDVEALIQAELQRYPEIEPFFDRVRQIIESSRVPTNTFVQHPEFPAVTCQLGRGFYRTPDNKLYSYKEQPAPGYIVKRGTTQSFSPTEIKNYIVQGEGGEWAKAAMKLALHLYYKYKNFGSLALLVNQVHDAMYADAHNDVALTAAAALHAAMEEASTYMEWFFGWEIPVPVPSDTTWGASMMDEDKIHDEAFTELVAKFKHELRHDLMASYVPTFNKE